MEEAVMYVRVGWAHRLVALLPVPESPERLEVGVAAQILGPA
ncbi:MAG TPA: hypothetical protein VIE89_16295 [Candidatus Binatia bacterium]|jgi:hypothetical protein